MKRNNLLKLATFVAAALVSIAGLSTTTLTAKADNGNSAKFYVTIGASGKFAVDKEGHLMANVPVFVPDYNNDGKYNYAEILRATHEEYYIDGVDGYASFRSPEGLGLSTLWGVSNGGSYAYYHKETPGGDMIIPPNLESIVEPGSEVNAFIYRDISTWTDKPTIIQCDTNCTTPNEAKTFTVLRLGYDENYNFCSYNSADVQLYLLQDNSVLIPLSEADGITEYDTITGQKKKSVTGITDLRGRVTLSFAEKGSYKLCVLPQPDNYYSPTCFTICTNSGITFSFDIHPEDDAATTCTVYNGCTNDYNHPSSKIGECPVTIKTISEATCTSAAIKEVSATYTYHGVTYSDSQTFTSGNPAGHHEVTLPAVAATCTTAGKTEGKKCDVCDTILVAQESVPKLGHNYKSKLVKATTSKDGYTIDECATCKKTKNKVVISHPTTYTLSATSYVYNGSAQKPTVKVKANNGTTIASSNYSVTYSSGCKLVGTYNVTIKFKGNYSGTVTKSYTIVPVGTTLKSLKAGSKSMEVNWAKQSTQITGYQIQYDNCSDLSSATTVLISDKTVTTKTIKKLSTGTKYYVRIRTYKEVNSKKIYSAWSPKLSVKVK